MTWIRNIPQASVFAHMVSSGWCYLRCETFKKRIKCYCQALFLVPSLLPVSTLTLISHLPDLLPCFPHLNGPFSSRTVVKVNSFFTKLTFNRKKLNPGLTDSGTLAEVQGALSAQSWDGWGTIPGFVTWVLWEGPQGLMLAQTVLSPSLKLRGF